MGCFGVDAFTQQLSDLGYSPGWSSLLEPATIAGAHARLVAGELSDPSGLRRGDFRRLVDDGPLDAAGIAQLLALAGAEPDPKVRAWVLKRLLRSPRLDRWRLELLKVHPAVVSAGLVAVAERASLLRGVAEPEPDESVLRAALESGDEALHQALLELSPLAGWVRAGLVEHGASRAIRQAARARGGTT